MRCDMDMKGTGEGFMAPTSQAPGGEREDRERRGKGVGVEDKTIARSAE